ncbi:MAG: ATP-dependent zinc metalloprotease FtsH [candidate division WOR-3 bacterium]|nr:ATP-dependent zinc metalloprotease FtsH [candidate division WOR-3 bacterium]
MEKPVPKNRLVSQLLIWLLIFLVAWAVWNFFALRRGGKTQIDFSRFYEELDKGNIESVIIVEKDISGKLKEESIKLTTRGEQKFVEFKTYLPFDDPALIKKLLEKRVVVNAKPSTNWTSIVLGILPWLLILGIWFLFIRRMSSGPDRAFSFGKSRARVLNEDRPKITFDDVAGVDEAKEELKEVIEFLKAPHKFQKLGGKIPKGVLLVGPTGTGKTLLARAVAGEAGVPFLSISGSDFVEMFVGVGAARVRDLFEQGKRNAPCIIFIDEIDAVGRQRGAGLGGGHDEREQTLNQLLVEMDGFEATVGVIIMAATNRPDILDLALLRPGRFDRQIVVDPPDVNGREAILKVHTKKIPVAPNVDMKILARGTPGFSGADLANMVNEAALLAARRNRTQVAMQDFEDAKDKVLMGVERKSLLISEQEKQWIAYHEAGHTLVSKLIPGTDPIHKVTIIPRGRALGITQQLPIDDRKIYSKTYCLNQLAVMLGGRASEILVFNDLSTGARDDIDRATQLARKMVCEWGMSERLGPLTFGKKDEEIFLGREMGLHRNFSEETAQLIDEEIKRMVEGQSERASKLVKLNKKKLIRLAKALLEKEILESAEIDRILIEPEEKAPEPEPAEAVKNKVN